MKSYQNGTTTYYRYRKDGDARLRLLRPSWLKGRQVLDIGCNSGDITLAVAKTFQPCFIEGIDVDDGLIVSAQQMVVELRRQANSQQRSHVKMSPSPSSFVFIPRSVAQKTPITPPIGFPFNINFKTADVLHGGGSGVVGALEKTDYDTILCLSVTKWVHLNTGDEGLLNLFQTAFQLLRPGGIFVLEYQPWKSYIKNRNTSDVTKATFLTLKLKPEDFESLLETEGFIVSERLGTPLSEAKGFNRPVLVLTKPDIKSTSTDTIDVANADPQGDKQDEIKSATKKKSKKRKREKEDDGQQDEIKGAGKKKSKKGKREKEDKASILEKLVNNAVRPNGCVDSKRKVKKKDKNRKAKGE